MLKNILSWLPPHFTAVPCKFSRVFELIISLYFSYKKDSVVCGSGGDACDICNCSSSSRSSSSRIQFLKLLMRFL